MQLQDYYSALSIYIPTLPTLPTASVYDAINRARRDLAAMSDITMTVTSLSLLANTASYAYPTVNGCDIISIYKYGVWGYNGNLRYAINRRDAAEYPLANFNGLPSRYWLKNRTITFWPTPAIAMQSDLKVKLRPVTLANPTDTDNQITEEYQDALTFLAGSYVAMADRNQNLAEYLKEQFKEQMSRLPRDNM